MTSLYRVVFLAMMVIVQMISRGAAFKANSATVRRRLVTSPSALNAWSLPNPTIQSSFGSLTNTWYIEVKNPTARATVYNDVPMEYKFVTLGTDWPSIGDRSSVKSENVNPKRRMLPIPQVIRRLMRGRRRPNQSL